jgi:hypothetical protein
MPTVWSEFPPRHQNQPDNIHRDAAPLVGLAFSSYRRYHRSESDEPELPEPVLARETAPLARAGPQRIPHRQPRKVSHLGWEWPEAPPISWLAKRSLVR